ncbi:MAG: hypothetical protein EOP89_04830 [Lysobacteraceae bacterium]|nr:MAG: hypothetical protein EOP89_04830 [Xanthomonadaceae bacterium]
MKFFKHYCDARNGTTMNSIFEADGHRGVSCYWMLVELCAGLMNKDRDEEWTEDHCKFQIHDRELRSNLRVTRATLASILRLYGTKTALRSQLIGSVWHIEFPKLLEILNRDAKRTRPGRATDAPKKKKENQEEERERENARAPATLPELSLWWNFQEGLGKVEALDRLTGAKGFRATFEWVLDPKNLAKIDAGAFDDGEAGGGDNVLNMDDVKAAIERNRIAAGRSDRP